MSSNLIRSAVLSAAVLMAVAVLAACTDSSTASKIQDPRASATTSGGTAATDSEAESESEVPAAAPSEADAAVPQEPDSPPATAPDPSTTVPADYPDQPATQVQRTDAEKRYIDELKRENVSFKGDTDYGIALTIGYYACQARANKTDPTMIKAYVTAAVGPATSDTAQASAAADKVIAAANRHLC